MPATDPAPRPPQHMPFWLKAARRQLARLAPEEATALATWLLEEARARQEEAALRARTAPLPGSRRTGPLLLRPQNRVRPPLRLLPAWRVDGDTR